MNFSNHENGENLAFSRIFPFFTQFQVIIKSEPRQISKIQTVVMTSLIISVALKSSWPILYFFQVSLLFGHK